MSRRSEQRNPIAGAPLDQRVDEGDRSAGRAPSGRRRSADKVGIGVEVPVFAGRLAKERNVGVVMNAGELIVAGVARSELHARQRDVRTSAGSAGSKQAFGPFGMAGWARVCRE
jgi:hypothetical protein